MKRILVTGGCGFIGSHIVDVLLDHGYEVAVFDNLSTGRLEHINGRNVTFYLGDIVGRDMERAVAEFKPDCVIHEAAQVSVPHSVLYYDEDANVNIIGTINVIDACRRNGVQKIIFASSAAVYGSAAAYPVPVSSPARPASPYGLSKYTAEQYLRLIQELYGLGHVILRYSNVYGPRQNAQGEGGVISTFFHQILRHSQPSIFGDGEQTRDFVFVKDVAMANLKAIAYPFSGTFNVSTGGGISINHVFQEIRRQCKSGIQPVHEPPRSGDIRHSALCSRESMEELKWRPAYSIAEGLRETLHYYQKNRGATPPLLSSF